MNFAINYYKHKAIGFNITTVKQVCFFYNTPEKFS